MNTLNSSFKQIDPDLGMIRQDQISVRQPQVGQGQPGADGVRPSGFFNMLQQSMEQVNTDQVAADHSIQNLMAGKSKNIHETMLAIQKADLSLKTMMQVRNKILEAYKEIMRMQV